MPVKGGVLFDGEAVVERVGKDGCDGLTVGTPRIGVGRMHGYITCLSIRCKSLASSPRPRLMRLLTVPSGMRRTVAISL